MKAQPTDGDPPGKPKAIIVDRKFRPEDLKVPRNQAYVRDLGQCFRIYQKWGYDIIWAEDGIECLRALQEWHDDVLSVVIEGYIPGNGFTLARLIRFKPDCRHIPVFLMATQMSEKDIAQGRRIGAAACLTRPFRDLANLETCLKTGKATQEDEAAAGPADPRGHILKELEKITGLPVMPTVYSEVDVLSKNPASTTEEYARIIELDPGITTQMLRLCNSSAFSFSRQITSVKDAVNLLGLQTVIDFVRTLSVVGAFKGKAEAFDREEFWQHCIAVGVISKLLADRKEINRRVATQGVDPFMAGMVHDIGKLVLGHFFNEMYRMVLRELRGGVAMYTVEREVLGITHAEIGLGLATKWQLPRILTGVIGNHHSPPADGTEGMTHLVHLADVWAKHFDMAFSEKGTRPAPSEATMELVGLDAGAMDALRKEVETTARRLVADTFTAIFR